MSKIWHATFVVFTIFFLNQFLSDGYGQLDLVMTNSDKLFRELLDHPSDRIEPKTN